ncbi:urease accessory protein UreH domain-containing protein [Sunxiuqinia indica]|uniref:urease accessory protein UreH domain-containing protein n=1 Tax=Sunxiuqinia indica TaxID=2692584 RepID=UPI00135934E5|nr:sulfite exporter TauE/SafE family protein [Sunxiuqinia indica]
MQELYLLSISAASLGFIHTILGPDHYLPFIVLSKARQWSSQKTMWITFISGIGHVGSSVLIGFIGIALGISLNKLKSFESLRGEMVGWLLIAFGVGYSIYGIYKYIKSLHHVHLPSFLLPKRIRDLQHLPTEEQTEDNVKLTPWILFLIFVFGPCEVLIPMLIFPAYEHSTIGMLTVAIIFGIATIGTMLLAVYLGHKGTSLVRFKKHERYLHLIAGLIITISGVGIVFMGW